MSYPLRVTRLGAELYLLPLLGAIMIRQVCWFVYCVVGALSLRSF